MWRASVPNLCRIVPTARAQRLGDRGRGVVDRVHPVDRHAAALELPRATPEHRLARAQRERDLASACPSRRRSRRPRRPRARRARCAPRRARSGARARPSRSRPRGRARAGSRRSCRRASARRGTPPPSRRRARRRPATAPAAAIAAPASSASASSAVDASRARARRRRSHGTGARHAAGLAHDEVDELARHDDDLHDLLAVDVRLDARAARAPAPRAPRATALAGAWSGRAACR